jgi:HK97 family phage major capsid protein
MPMASRLTSLKNRQGEIADKQKANAAKLEDASLTAEARATIVAESKGLEAEFQTVTDEVAVLEQAAAKQKREIKDGTLPVHVEVRERNDDDPRRGFRNMADFALTVRGACTGGSVDKRLASLANSPRLAAPTGYMQESSGSAGEGYMLPPEFQGNVQEIVFAEDGIIEAMKPEPTDASAVEFDADETTPWGSSGVQAVWRSEAGQMTATKAITNPKLNKLHELYAFVTASGELMQDLPRLNDRLTRKSGMAIRWKAEDALVNGDGVGKPLGFAATQNPSRLTVAKDSGQAANTLSVANLANMLSQLLADGGDPFWVIHRTCTAALFGLSIGNQPAFLPSNQPIAGKPGGTLFGLPVKFSEHAQTLSSLGDVQLVNPAGYQCNVKSGADLGMKFDMSIHLFFDYNLTAFRWIFRIGGQPILSAGVSPKNGTTKRSHSLVLQNR